MFATGLRRSMFAGSGGNDWLVLTGPRGEPGEDKDPDGGLPEAAGATGAPAVGETKDGFAVGFPSTSPLMMCVL
jgi:hypothetical protein